MSDAGDILSAISTDVAAAVSGVTVSLLAEDPKKIGTATMPWCRLLMVDYSVEPLDYAQEERTWTIAGLVVEDAGTRETMQTKLEAIRDQVFADATLGSVVKRATCATLVPYSSPDDARIMGEFFVSAVKVV
jgi:hypothetical protein